MGQSLEECLKARGDQTLLDALLDFPFWGRIMFTPRPENGSMGESLEPPSVVDWVRIASVKPAQPVYRRLSKHLNEGAEVRLLASPAVG